MNNTIKPLATGAAIALVAALITSTNPALAESHGMNKKDGNCNHSENGEGMGMGNKMHGMGSNKTEERWAAAIAKASCNVSPL